MLNSSTPSSWLARLAVCAALLAAGSITSRAADIAWTNATGGTWQIAANWSPNRVPTSSDNVSITAPGSYIVTASINASMARLTVGGTSGAQTLSITAGTLTAATSGTVGTNAVLALAGGALAGGTMTVQGTMNWTAGKLKSGLSIAAGATLNLSGNTLKLLNGGTLVNSGTVIWAGNGGIQFDEGSTIDNRGALEILNDATLVQTLFTTRPWFANSGVLRKRTATGTTTFGDVELRNSGTVDVQSGTVSLASKTHSFSGNTAISGAGQFKVAGATLNLSGTIDASSPLRVTLGKAVGTYTLNGELLVDGGQTEGALTLNGILNLSSGKDVSTATINGHLNISGGEAAGVTAVSGNLNLSGGSATGTLTVNGNLNWSGGLLPGSKVAVQGDTLWSSGTMSGKFTIPAGRVLTIPAGANVLLSGATLTNLGTIAVTAGQSLKCSGGAILYNHGVFTLADGAAVTATSTDCDLLNFGTLRKTGADVTLWKDVQYAGGGTIDVQAGLFSLQGLLTHTLNANASITGAGRFAVAGATLALGANVTAAPSLEILSGTVAASGSFHGNIEWTAGSLAGTLTVPVGRQIHLTGTGIKTFTKDSVLNVAGTALLDGSGSLLFFANAAINNTGAFEIQTAGNFTFNGSEKAWFNNAGTLRKTVSTAALPFGALQLINTGTLDLQAGDLSLTANVQSLQNGSTVVGPGAVRVNGATLSLAGAVSSASPVYLVLGSLSGMATLAAPLDVSGGLLSGAITVNGPVTCSAGQVTGTLTVGQTMDWTGGTVSGTLVVPSGASLTVKPGGTRLLSGVLNNAGLVTVLPSGAITLVNGKPFVNSGTFEVQDEIPFKLSGTGKPEFNNTGTFRKTTSTKTLPLSFVILQNSGTLDVQAGGIDFTLNTHTFANGSRLIGPGPVRIAGATVMMNTALRVECPFTLASGYLLGDAAIAGSLSQAGGQIPGLVTVSRDFTWAGGEVKGTLTVSNQIAWSMGTLSGTLNLPASARLEVQPGATKLLTGTLNNYGILNLPALTQIQMDSGCVINNAGHCETTAEDPFGHLDGGIPTFNNTGTFRKLGGKDTDVSLKVIFNHRGLLEVATNALNFISGTHTFSSGSRITGAGLTRIAGATVNWNGAVTNTCPVELASGSLLVEGSINGAITWSGGTLRGNLTIPATSELRLVGTSTKTLQGITVTNLGSVLLEGKGPLAFTDDAIIQNYGVFELQTDNSFTVPNSGKKWFNNYGVLRKENSTQPLVFSGVLLHNSGTLDVQAGTMDFTLNDHALNNGSQVIGSGALRVAGATMTLSGNNSFSQPLQLNSGILAGTATNTGGLTVAGGQINGNLTVNGSVPFSAGILAGTLTANQTIDWSGGTISGTLVIPATANLTVKSGGTRLLTGTINNAGNATVLDSAFITLVNGTPLVNSGTFEVQDELPFKLSGTSKPAFINSGLFRKTISTRTLSLSFLLLQNSGTVDVQAGGIDFTLNSHIFANGTRFTGPGPVRIDGATATMNGVLRVESPFELASGYLAGDGTIAGSLTMSGGQLPGVVVVTNAFIWSGGEVKGALAAIGSSAWEGGLLSGTLTVPAAARASILPGGAKSISGVFQNAGFTVVSNNATITLLGGTPIVNSGMLEVQNEQPFKPNGTTKVNFINSGTFRKTSSTKLMKLDYVQLQNSGTLDLQAGELSLLLNSHSFADGSRTIGTGVVHVAGATLNVAGNLTLGPALALDSGYLAGNATLNGPFQFNGGEVQDKLKVIGPFAWAGGFLKGGVWLNGAATWTGGEIDGWLSIATNSTLAIGGAATKTIKGGTLTNSGFVTATSPVTIQGDGGAVVQNFGAFNLPVSLTVTTPWGGKPTFNNFGSLSLTNGFGVFTFPGKLLQFPSGRLDIELGGRNAGVDFSQIINVPELALDGGLSARTVGGFEPDLGDRLEIIKCVAREGTFASYSANTPRLSPDYSASNVTLVAAAPTLTSQPVSQTVGSGTTVNFSASAYGSQPMRWQWLRNGAPLPAATNASLALANVQPAHEGAYVAVVANIWGSATSTQALLKVVVPPTITRQPVALTVNQGQTATFSVEASGNYLSYRWRFGDNWLPGATNATLVLNNVTAANAGKYKVEVSNLGGTVVSTEVIFTVISPPTITEQPASQNVGAGSNPSLSVKVSGTAPFSYLWLKDGAPVAGATNASLTLNNVGANQAGSYVVLVANAAGTATSQPATIAIKTLPMILAQPLSQSVNIGSNVLLTVTAMGVPAPTYQWRKNGVNLSGATSSTLLLPNIQPSHAGDYSVSVANSQGSVESAGARLTVVVPELLFTDEFVPRSLIYSGNGYGHGTNFGATKEIGEPSHAGKGSATRTVWISWWAPANGIVTFSTGGSDFDTVLAVYRGTAVNALSKVAADDDAAGFHCSKVSFNAIAGTYYQIAVAGDGGSAGNIILSWNLLITAELLPEISQAPLDITGNTNDVVALQVVFSAFEPTAIQWFYQGQTLAGATNATFVIASLQEDKVGGYAVRLTGASGRNVVSPPGDVQINTEGISSASARNKFFDAAERALNP